MAKNNQKCVRMSDDVLNIVTKVEGEGFNEKFERLVIDYKHTIPEREKMVRYLDDKIAEKKQELRTVEERISKLKNIEFSLENLRRDILRIIDAAKVVPVVSQKEAAAPGDPEQNEIQKKGRKKCIS